MATHSQSNSHSHSATITADVFQRVMDIYEITFAEIKAQVENVEHIKDNIRKEFEWLRTNITDIRNIKDNTAKTMKSINEMKEEIILLKKSFVNINMVPKTDPSPKPINSSNKLEITSENSISFNICRKNKKAMTIKLGTDNLKKAMNLHQQKLKISKDDDLFNIRGITETYKTVVFDNWNEEKINNNNDNLQSTESLSLFQELPVSLLNDNKEITYKTFNDINQNETKTIQHLEIETHANFIHSDKILCMKILNDNRIATGSEDKSISICKINIETNAWNRDIHKKKAHNGGIYSLTELNNDKLISCSWDGYIKIWDIEENDIILNKTIKGHQNMIFQIMNLSNERFASCSYDQNIKIWNYSNEEITSMIEEDGKIYAMIQLQNKEILVTSCSYPSLAFWNLNTYKKESVIKEGFYARRPSHIVELFGNRIAVSTCSETFPIIIIDTVKYSIVKKIQIEGFIIHDSSLCIFDQFSFVYSYSNYFVQFSSNDYRVIFKNNNDLGIDAVNGIVIIEQGKYLIMTNNSYGLTVVQPFYG